MAGTWQMTWQIVYRWLTWTAVVLLFTACGFAIGLVLDWMFWNVSFDYVYRPRQFAVSAAKVGLFIGAIVAAGATAGAAAPARPRTLMVLWLCLASAAVVSGLAAGGVAVGLSKWVVPQPATETLAPRARVWFCDAVWSGAFAGAVLTACLATLWVLRRRFGGPAAG